MRFHILPFALLLHLLTSLSIAAEPVQPGDEPSSLQSSLRVIGEDYRALVERPRLYRLLGGLAAAGIVANTDADQSLYDEYWEWSASSDLGGLSSAAKVPGEAGIVLPLFIVPALMMGVDEVPDQSSLGRWWRRTARAYLVGAPPLYYLQQITGGERPGDPGGSSWQPFEGNHGISGHAFMGAVPLLTAARQTDNRWLKATAIGLSVLPAWSRLEDGKHFPSQVALGWFLAWEVTGAIAGDGEPRAVAVLPLATEDGLGLAVHFTFP